ncbi:MAG: DUF2946 family protein [Burkholderiaceae bacterium]|nr:DUF2946 family protein [Burkholderiaceae bacterium]
MTAPRSFLRPARAASLLALLAVLAQLWMGQLSHRHLAQQAGAWLQWGEVCSAQNPKQAGSVETTAPMGGMAMSGCPVCALAHAGTVPSPAFRMAETALRPPASAPGWHRAATPMARGRGVRPPAQAPPLAA